MYKITGKLLNGKLAISYAVDRKEATKIKRQFSKVGIVATVTKVSD